MLLNGQNRLRVVDVGGGVGAVHPVGQELLGDGRVGLEGDHQTSRNRVAVGVQRARSVEPHDAGSVRGIVLPAAPDDSVTPAHQEPIARVGRLVGR